MEKQIVVMFPALVKPEGVTERMEELCQFVYNVFCEVPEAIIVPLLNGPDVTVLNDFDRQFEERGCNALVVSNARGLNSVLYDGYQILGKKHPQAVIVRLDDKEHPISQIPGLIEKALVDKAMVVGDLVFDSDKIEPGSDEDLYNNKVFPIMYRLATKRDDLGLSTAHGLQIFPSGKICLQILNIAWRIILEAEKRAGKPVIWGLDGVMVLTAGYLERWICITGVKVVRAEITAIQERKRALEKIREQFENHLSNWIAAESVFASLNQEAIARLGI